MTERLEAVGELVVDDGLSRRSLMRVAVMSGGLVTALLVAGCDAVGTPSSLGVSSEEERREADARATADAVATVEDEQAAEQLANDGRKVVDNFVFGGSKGAVANTVFDDLARKGSVFGYHKDSSEWRWSNPAAADDEEDNRTAVSASFDLRKLTIEKQAEVDGRIIRVYALCSLPENARIPAGINTKAEIRHWVDDNRSHLRVERLAYESTPTDRADVLKGRGPTSDMIEVFYDTASDDFDSISGNFDKAFLAIFKNWSAIKDARP